MAPLPLAARHAHRPSPPARTPEFAALILEHVQDAALRYEQKLGHAPDTGIIQTPSRILGPQNRRQPGGTFGVLGPYRVLMDPCLMFNEFGLYRGPGTHPTG